MQKTNWLTKHSRDADIRAPLIEWINHQHRDCDETGLIEEFKMPRPSARIDVAVINGELSGFEIKSDADTLVRLNNQVQAFSRFFDKVSIVTTKKHVSNARKIIPSWWGIMVCDAELGIKITRAPKQNKALDNTSLLYALSKREIIRMAHICGEKISQSRTKSEMVSEIEQLLSASDIRETARHILRKRV